MIGPGLRRSVGLIAAFAIAQAGCGVTGTYQPRPSPRIAVVDVTRRTYMRGGQRYELGLTGRAEDLVSGNELAVTQARKYRRNTIVGLTLYGIGTAMMFTGIGLDLGSDPSDPRRSVGNALFLGSLLPILTSLGFLIEAPRNLQNAVNIYNDALEGPIDPHAFDDLPAGGGP